ncbi:MAG: aminotransferase class V-fold PLP-dependent enzyme [Planctomycetota bacterium]
MDSRGTASEKPSDEVAKIPDGRGGGGAAGSRQSAFLAGSAASLVERFREQMPVARRWAYFDHAAVAPLSGPAQKALVDWCADATENGDVGCPVWARQVEEVRAAASQLLGAREEEIALTANTTAGINFVAEGFPWREGDNIVTRADEFPTNQYPWMHLAARGVEARRVVCSPDRPAIEQLAEACDLRTRILAVSWVTFAGGYRHDLAALAELAHRRGALLLVDGIQGLGVFPLSVADTPIDFLSADGHKWMLGPEGAGVFYCRRKHLDRLHPIGVGWNSVVNEHDFSHIDLRLKPTTARYEGGSQNSAGILSLGASLRLLLSLGAGSIAERVLAYSDEACELLRSLGAVIHSDRSPEHRSGIVSFEIPGADPMELRRRCLEEQIVLSCRGGRLRISPHGYNDSSDLDRLITALGRR